MKMKSRIAATLLFLIAAFSLMGMDMRATTLPYHYVALGDSLTTGFEPGVTQPYGFVDRLYEQSLFRGRASLANYGVNGLTSTGLKDLVESAVGATDEKSKSMIRDIEEAQLITITIGGNDFRELPQLVQKMSKDELREYVSKGVEVYGQQVTTVLNRLYQLNPQVQIVMADQYQPVPPMDPATYESLNMAAEMFTHKLNEVIDPFLEEDKNIGVAEVAKLFRGKEMMLTHILSLDIHPNQLGYEEMAKAFTEVIWADGEYRGVEAGVPVTVVLNGERFQPPWAPLLLKDRTYVTLREYAEAIGADVEWDESAKKVMVKKGDQAIQVVIGSDELAVNGERIKLSAPVLLVNDKTYVPLRVLAEGLQLQVEYSAPSRTVFVNQ